MIKTLKHKTENKYRVVELAFGKIRNQKVFIGKNAQVEAYNYGNALRKNANKRERNEILRDISGTSAAAARRDMGR